MAILVPALVATAAAHVNAPAPEVTLSVNDAPAEVVKSVSAILEKAVNLENVKTISDCLRARVEEAPSTPLMLAMTQASVQVDAAIQDWAKATGRDPALAVAAFCENPGNWQNQLGSWDEMARKFDQMGDAGDKYRQNMMNLAYEGVGARAWAVQHAIYEISDVAPQGSLPVMKVRGDVMGWINAAASVAGGAAEVVGNREARDVVRGAANTARRGGGYVRRGESIGRRSNVYDQVKGVGDLMGSVGREVNRTTPKRSRYQNPL